MKLSDINIERLSNYFAGFAHLKKQLLMLFVGAFSVLSFAPVYFFPAFMISLSLLLIVVMVSKSPYQAFKYGYMFGFGHFFAGLYWIGNSFAVEPDIPDWAGYFMVALMASILAFYPGLVAAIVKRIYRGHSLKTHLLPVVISFSVLWAFSEWLRGVLFSGFPWNLSGYVWGFSDAMLQNTAIWGIYGLSLITIILSFLPLFIINKGSRVYAGLFSMITVGALFFYGQSRLSQEVTFVDNINLRVVQANIKQEDKWPYENWGKNLITHMELSETDEENDIKDIIIWPETSIIYSLTEEPMRRELISGILDEGDMLLTGFPRRQRDPGATRIFNSLISIDDQGDVRGFYDKSHLVPFGEYIPSFIKAIMIPLGLDQLFTGGQGFSAGEGLKTFDIEGYPSFGALICYEIIFPGQVTEKDNRPDWLLNITNDAWYGNSSGPRQHLLQTRVRAIEEGLPLVRSATTGISAIIDPYGRVLHKIPLNSRGVVNGRLPNKITTNTQYSSLKEWLYACISAILLIANVVIMRRYAPYKR